MGPFHIINEAKSPPHEPVWTMWCGTTCIALDNGGLIPPIDFYSEEWADKATCLECKNHMNKGEEEAHGVASTPA